MSKAIQSVNYDTNVYCGRGGNVNQRPGNISFRERCRNNDNNYRNLARTQKAELVNDLLRNFINDGFKFFDEDDRQMNPFNNMDDSERILDKISQTIRDTSSVEKTLPEPRRKPLKISIDSKDIDQKSTSSLDELDKFDFNLDKPNSWADDFPMDDSFVNKLEASKRLRQNSKDSLECG